MICFWFLFFLFFFLFFEEKKPGSEKKEKPLSRKKKLKKTQNSNYSIRAYASYVDSISDLEASQGCELCSANRRALERVWQTVSQEYYPPPGRAFSQRAWAARLPAALRASGGALRTAEAARAAARDLVASLGDRYTEYLGPEAYRAALRRPLAGVRKIVLVFFLSRCFLKEPKLTSIKSFFRPKKPKLGARLCRGEGRRRRRHRRRGTLFIFFVFSERRPCRRGSRRILGRGRRHRAGGLAGRGRGPRRGEAGRRRAGGAAARACGVGRERRRREATASFFFFFSSSSVVFRGGALSRFENLCFCFFAPLGAASAHDPHKGGGCGAPGSV